MLLATDYGHGCPQLGLQEVSQVAVYGTVLGFCAVAFDLPNSLLKKPRRVLRFRDFLAFFTLSILCFSVSNSIWT